MAQRPVFSPAPAAPGMVVERSFAFPWAGGFAATQKRKNIGALHAAAAAAGLSPILEVSTKSEIEAGRRLSAFNLTIPTCRGDRLLECVFQGSKRFERGGPFLDLLDAEPREAKRDPRLQSSGALLGFAFEGRAFPLQPLTVFYDWLYLSAAGPLRGLLSPEEGPYAGFSDIEFHPGRSINCQARSCALMVALDAAGRLDDALASADVFLATMVASHGRARGG